MTTAQQLAALRTARQAKHTPSDALALARMQAAEKAAYFGSKT